MLKATYGSVVLSRDVCDLAFRKSATGIKTRSGAPRRKVSGLTIAEVVIAMAISTMIFATVINAYVSANDRAEWTSYSFAAQSLAVQGIEQARAAQWAPESWPVIDNLPVTNYTRVEKLDLPMSGLPVFATNYISVSTIATSPQIRQLRADCVWVLVSRYHGAAGPFTNTAVTFRAADQ